jgi:hypothetical protein
VISSVIKSDSQSTEGLGLDETAGLGDGEDFVGGVHWKGTASECAVGVGVEGELGEGTFSLFFC